MAIRLCWWRCGGAPLRGASGVSLAHPPNPLHWSAGLRIQRSKATADDVSPARVTAKVSTRTMMRTRTTLLILTLQTAARQTNTMGWEGGPAQTPKRRKAAHPQHEQQPNREHDLLPHQAT
jgi:hypothetical protein